MKKIAVINDLSGFGKCSLTAALPIISAHGIQACPLPTGVFSNQTDYESFYACDLTGHMQPYINEWRRLGAEFDGILTGFIPSSLQGRIISDFIDEFKKDSTVLAVDPVMGDNGELYKCYTEDSIREIRSLAEKADIITPNVTELALLCEEKPDGEYSLNEIEEMSRSLNIPMVVTTGIKLGENEIANAVFDGGFRLVTSKKQEGSYSGTGDILVSFVLAEYLNSGDVYSAVSKASAFISKALEGKASPGYHPEGIDFENLINIK